MTPLARLAGCLLLLYVSSTSSKVGSSPTDQSTGLTQCFCYRDASRMRNIPVQTTPPVVLCPLEKVSQYSPHPLTSHLSPAGIGCCPYPDATCCADKMHCCPHGMSCDVKGARCIGTGYQLLFSRLSGPPTKPRVNQDLWLSLNKTKLDVKKFCPNHSFTCDTDQTCCQLKVSQ